MTSERVEFDRERKFSCKVKKFFPLGNLYGKEKRTPHGGHSNRFSYSYDGISCIEKAHLHKPYCAHSPLRIFYYRKLSLRESGFN
jgi:hypothetical protein